MREYDSEPVPGLPAPLPPGEHILWQGAPDPWVFARRALHVRWVAAYFTALALYGVAQGSLFGVAASIAAGIACLGFLLLFAWAVGRTSLYTLTNKRIVLRIGVALNACINLPLKAMNSAALKGLEHGHGDIAVGLESGRVSYVFLWPHVRPWRLASPEPMLRAVPDAASVATLLASARAELGPIAQTGPSRAAETNNQPLGVAA